MEIGRILIPLRQEALEYPLLESAYEVMRLGKASLQVCCCRNEPAAEIPYGSPVDGLAGLSLETLEDEATQAAHDIECRLRDWAGQKRCSYAAGESHIESHRIIFYERFGEPAALLSRLGRLSDLIICAKPEDWHANPGSVFDVSVLETGRPVLAIPRHAPEHVFQHILLCWDGSLVASRLVSQALPLLKMASKVTIFSYPERDAQIDRIGDLETYLRCHGIASKAAVVRRELPVADALIGVAVAEGVTLVAMGAYGHSRARQGIFGGLTRSMLATGSMPLLMVH